MPLIGIEADETLFVQAIFPPRAELYSIPAGGAHIPLMLMTYVGALKSWIYTPLFHVLPSNVFVLRIPMLLAGAASLWLFYLLLRRLAGSRAALIGCALLAADSGYLLTVVFDWGPVALQHLLVIGGALLLVRFYQEKRTTFLAGGCFLLGLAMWDKALAVWIFSGAAVAGAATIPRQIYRTLSLRGLGVAVLSFLLGAAPLLVYNVRNHWGTFAGNFEPETNGLAGKANMLRETARGAGLFSWMMADDWQTPKPHAAEGMVERASYAISEFAGHPRRHLLYYGFLLALLVAPLAGWNAIRMVLFSLIAMGVAWIQMAIGSNTGGSVHHTILLWPLPQLAMAASFAGVSRRLGRAGIPALAVVLAVLCASGLLVINEYYAVAVRHGGGQLWNNGIYALSDYLKNAPGKAMFCMDWNILDPLRMLHRGRLPLAVGTDPFGAPEMSDQDRRYAMEMIVNPEHVFLAHTKPFEVFEGRNGRMVEFAASQGYAREMMAVIADPFGRDVFEVYRFSKK